MAWLAFCNFCRVRRMLRVTPAMAAGIVDYIWSVRELPGGSLMPSCGGTVATSTFRSKQVEKFIREQWLCRLIGQAFSRSNIALRAGGTFQCDAASAHQKILACISTSAGRTISLKRSRKAAPKLHKIRSDILFMLCAEAERRIVILTDRSMYHFCIEQVNAGRMPQGMEFFWADIPSEMVDRLRREHYEQAREVTPGMPRTQI